MAGIVMDAPSTITADAKAEKRARKEKKALRKAAEQVQEENVAGPSSGVEIEKKETKEGRRARKEAKRLAKAAKAPAQPSEPEAGPSSVAAAVPKEETKEERKARRRAEKEAKKATEGQSLGETKTADVPPEAGSTKTKAKKRKHDTVAEEIAESQTSPAADSAAPEAVRESKDKKKKKQKTSEATTTSEDIFADSTLTDQAKKGGFLDLEGDKSLHYVRQHATAHLKSGAVSEGQAWKFNKAKQNWLIRNIWSDEVPDKYVDGVLGYLKTVLGASRKSMIDTAKKYLEPSQEISTAQAAGTDADGKDNPKEDAAEGDKADAGTGEDNQLRELRRARAGKLLSVLNE